MHIRGSSHPHEGFTLIELLIVIAIIAILAVVVVLTLNPAELLRQARDSNRLSDLATLTSAINLYNTDQGGAASYSLGSASTTYISVPDPTAATSTGNNCSGIGMSTSTTYHCASPSIYRNITSLGWIPVNFSKITSGSPIGSLPIDPTNQTSSGLYYSYATNGTTFELSANPESQKYTTETASNPTMFTAGSNTSLLTAGSVTNGSVSQANMKMSIASNTAFVDFSSAGTLTPYIGDKLTITDSAGHHLVGWIKAAGTGETYGSENLPNTNFNDTGYLWTYGSVTVASVSGGQSGNALQVTDPTGWSAGAGENFNLNIGGLYRYTTYWKTGTANGQDTSFSASAPSYTNYSYVGYSPPATWTQVSMYGTAIQTTNQIYWDGGAGTSLFDTASLTQVLTPSATGVIIVSASGGSSYNWTSEDSGFNRNDSSGYTYLITKS